MGQPSWVAHDCNSSTWEIEAGIQGHFQLHNNLGKKKTNFSANLGNIKTLSQKKNRYFIK